LNLHCRRRFKQKQLYLHGPQDTLKTSFLHILIKYCTTYEIPQQEDFYDLYPDPEPELCFLDEFKGGKTLSFLNLFLQGPPPLGSTVLKVKGAQALKRSNPPVIILSNYTLEENYKAAQLKRQENLKPTQVRLEFIEVTQPLDLKGFQEALATATLATIQPHLVPSVTYSDSDLTNRISELLTKENNNDLSPVLSRKRRSDSDLTNQESQVLTDSTDQQVQMILDQINAYTADESLLHPVTTDTVQCATSSTETTNKRFTKYRKVYDDILLDY